VTRLRWIVIAAVVALLLVPLWAFSRFPSQDGPSHVYNARLLLLMLQGRLPEAGAYYELHLAAFPNWVTHAALATLLTTVSASWAERLLLTGYVIALPLSFGYAVAAVRPASAHLTALVLPFVYNKWLHEGFYNRSLALVPFFLAIGYYVRRRGRLGLHESLALAAIVLWTYFSTATSLVVLVLTLLAFALAFSASERDGGSRVRAWRARVSGLLALVPACALLAWFSLEQHPQTTGRGPGLVERGVYLGNLYDVVAYDRLEAWIAAVFAGALAIGGLTSLWGRLRTRRSSPLDALLVVTVLLAAAYALAPQVSIPGVRSEPQHLRLSLHVLLAALLWVAAAVPARMGRLLAAAALATAAALTCVRLPLYSSFDGLVDEQLSLAAAIPRAAVFLPVSFDYEGSGIVRRRIAEDWIVGPLWHAGARVAAARDLVSLDDYEAATLHFPLRYRAGANPFELLVDPANGSPGCLRLGRFNRVAPRPVEYILLFRRALAPQDACTRRTLAYVDAHYDRVATSPRGTAELRRRNEARPTRDE
jgi:hypothetical protein